MFTLQLKAGDWELYTFQVNAHGERWKPDEIFSIPFTIREGRATYIGDFQPMGATVNGVLTDSAGPPRFVVTDRSARDIPVATAKTPGMGPVDVNIPNVDAMNNPLFASH